MMKGYTENVSAHPLAEVELEVGDQKMILTVALQGELKYDIWEQIFNTFGNWDSPDKSPHQSRRCCPAARLGIQ